MAVKTKRTRARLVQETAASLREMILAREPGAHIGSLRELARTLGVGIVTIQQAARVLEHEGLLAVRRGQEGGYYGMRPDEAALARAMSGFLLVHRSKSDDREAIDIMSMLDCELLPAAARCADESLREQLRTLGASIDARDTSDQRVAFENEMHDILFRMVKRPLMELLARVTMRHYAEHPSRRMYAGKEGIAVWKQQRHRIINAILDGDQELARFEAQRRRKYFRRALASNDNVC